MRKFCNRNIHTKKTITNRLPFPFCTFKTTYMLHPNGIILPLRESGSRFAAVFLISWSSPHPISNSQLRALLHFHPCPIYLVVFKGVYFFRMGHLILRGGFTLRCLQRLSLPDLATLPCSWHCNRYTSGPSIPVLSY